MDGVLTSKTYCNGNDSSIVAGAGLGTVHASGGGGAYEPPSLTSPQRSAELSCASPPPSWMNRQRIRFTVMQTSYLEDHYKKEPYPPLTARKKIAEEFNMKEKCIRVSGCRAVVYRFEAMGFWKKSIKII